MNEESIQTSEDTQETVTPETPAENPTPVEPKKDKLASRFAALSKKEKDLVAKEKLIQESAAKADEYKSLLDSFKTNPSKWLKANNLTFQEFADLIINEPDLENPSIEDRLNQTQKQFEDYKQSQLEKENAQAQAHNAQLKSEFEKLLSDHIVNNSDYELINQYNSVKDVQELIERIYIETRQVMPIQEAAKLIEEQLLEEKTHELEKIQKTKKLSSFFVKNSKEDLKDNEYQKDKKVIEHLSDNNNVKTEYVRKTSADRIAEAAKLIEWK